MVFMLVDHACSLKQSSWTRLFTENKEKGPGEKYFTGFSGRSSRFPMMLFVVSKLISECEDLLTSSNITGNLLDLPQKPVKYFSPGLFTLFSVSSRVQELCFSEQAWSTNIKTTNTAPFPSKSA